MRPLKLNVELQASAGGAGTMPEAHRPNTALQVDSTLVKARTELKTTAPVGQPDAPAVAQQVSKGLPCSSRINAAFQGIARHL